MEGGINRKIKVPTSGSATKSASQSGSVTASAKIPERSGFETKENSILNDLQKEVEALKEVSKRVKVEGVKNGIEKISSLLTLLVEHKNKRNAVSRLSLGQDSTIEVNRILGEFRMEVMEIVKESQETILGTIGQFTHTGPAPAKGARNDINGGNKMATAKDTATGTDPPWSEVVGRRHRRGQNTEKAVTTEPPTTAFPVKKRSVRSRPPAILVDIGENEFTEVAKKIHDKANMEVIGDSVVGVRQAKSGGILIEVRGGADRVESVRAEIGRSVGENFGVKTLQRKVLIEVRDLMGLTTEEEVVEALAVTAGIERDSLKVIGLRKYFGGSQSALILMPSETATKLLKAGRVLVGFVSCRVRLRDTVVKCSRCHSTGHMAKTCSGTDRSNCCWRCGSPEHKAKSCSANKEEAEVYSKVVFSTNSQC